MEVCGILKTHGKKEEIVLEPFLWHGTTLTFNSLDNNRQLASVILYTQKGTTKSLKSGAK